METPQFSNKPSVMSYLNGLPQWAKSLPAVAGAVLVLGGALWVGSMKYYQVNPLTATSTPTGEPVSDHKNTASFAEALSASSLFSNQEGDCPIYSVTDPSNTLSTSALSQMEEKICNEFAVKGVSFIQNAIPVWNSDEDVYYDGSAYGGVGTISLDRTYLVSFRLYRAPHTSEYRISFSNAYVLKTLQVSSFTATPMQNPHEDVQVIRVKGTDASKSSSEEYFATLSLALMPIVKNSDGTFSNTVFGGYGGYKLDVARVSFLSPYSDSAGGGSPDRNVQIEEQNGVSPVYHQASCGREDTYGDMGFYIADGDNGKRYQTFTTIEINFGYKPKLYVTTAMAGYDPAQWGKILSSVSFEDFKSRVQTSKAYNSTAPVEMLTIGGYTVKHVGPIPPTKTCTGTYETYQAVKNGAVVSFLFESSTTLDVQKIINQVLTTLTFSPR